MQAAVIRSQQDMLIRAARFNSGDGAEASWRLDGWVPAQSESASIDSLKRRVSNIRLSQKTKRRENLVRI